MLIDEGMEVTVNIPAELLTDPVKYIKESPKRVKDFPKRTINTIKEATKQVKKILVPTATKIQQTIKQSISQAEKINAVDDQVKQKIVTDAGKIGEMFQRNPTNYVFVDGQLQLAVPVGGVEALMSGRAIIDEGGNFHFTDGRDSGFQQVASAVELLPMALLTGALVVAVANKYAQDNPGKLPGFAPAPKQEPLPGFEPTDEAGWEDQGVDVAGQEPITEGYDIIYPESEDEGFSILPDWLSNLGNVFTNDAKITPERARHILGGDATGGGHKYGTGIPGKSEFPSNWSDDKILEEVSNIANDPSIPGRTQSNGRIVKDATVDGTDIRVVIESKEKGGNIVTGYPTNTPRNPK